MFKFFIPRFSWIFTIIAAATITLAVEPWNLKAVIPYAIVWVCGMMSGLLDAAMLEEKKDENVDG